MNRLPCLAAFVMALTALPAYADGPPKFADYPAKVYTGSTAKPRLDSPDLRRHSALFQGHRDRKVDAGGHYIVVKLPCGAACAHPALLDARSGRTTGYATVSGWREVGDDFDPVASRADSRLIVFRGARNEAGINGNHYYLIEDGGKLKHLYTMDTSGNFETSSKIE